MRTLRFIQLIVILMAAGGCLAVLIGFFGDLHWYADLFAHLRPQYCIWLGLALIGAWKWKSRLAMVLAAVGLLINGLALAPYAVPRPKESPGNPAGPVLTIVSMNLLYGNLEVPKVMEYVRRMQADVIIFEEVSARWARDLETLSDLYPHRMAKPRKDGFGFAVFSREKPAEVEVRLIGVRETDLAAFGVWENQGRRINIVGVHPDKPDKEWKVRNRQAYFDSLAKWYREKEAANEPVVILGDFNATPWSSSMKTLVRETGLRNVNQGNIFGASWTVWQPHRMLIDHALLSSHWSLLDHEIGPAVGSDHRPLMIRVAVKD